MGTPQALRTMPQVVSLGTQHRSDTMKKGVGDHPRESCKVEAVRGSPGGLRARSYFLMVKTLKLLSFSFLKYNVHYCCL
jgi:hypothetical protein